MLCRFINNDDRDRRESDWILKTSIKASDILTPYLRYTNTEVDYFESYDDFFINRDSRENIVELGTGFTLSKVAVQGDISTGYFEKKNTDVTLGSVNNWIGNISLLWKPSARFTANYMLKADFLETTIAGSPGNFEISSSLNLTYEFTKKWEISPSLTYTKDDYENISLEDDTYAIGMKTTYHFTEKLSCSLEYSYTDRSSSISSGDYSSNVVSVVATGTF